MEGLPKTPTAPAEKIPPKEFSSEEKERYQTLAANFFEKARDFEVKDVGDTQWDETLSIAERELRSFDFPGSTKIAQEDPTRLNTAQRVLIQQLEGSIHYGQNPELFSPEMRPVLDKQYKEARQLFTETAARLYPDVTLSNSAEIALRSVRRQTENLQNPILKDYFKDLPISNADSLRGGDPAKLLERVENALYQASNAYESAQGISNPNNPKELAAFGKSLYTLELLRQDLENRVKERENADTKKPSGENQNNFESTQQRYQRLQEESNVKAEEAARLDETRKRLGIDDKKSETPIQPVVEAKNTDWHSGPLTSLLKTQTLEEVRSMLTPQMEQIALSKALYDLDETIKIGMGYSTRNPGKTRNALNLNLAWGLSVQGNLGAIYQRIILAKTGKVIDISEIGKMPVSEFMQTAFGYDLTKDDARKDSLQKWTNILGNPKL